MVSEQRYSDGVRLQKVKKKRKNIWCAEKTLHLFEPLVWAHSLSLMLKGWLKNQQISLSL